MIPAAEAVDYVDNQHDSLLIHIINDFALDERLLEFTKPAE